MKTSTHNKGGILWNTLKWYCYVAMKMNQSTRYIAINEFQSCNLKNQCQESIHALWCHLHECWKCDIETHIFMKWIFKHMFGNDKHQIRDKYFLRE